METSNPSSLRLRRYRWFILPVTGMIISFAFVAYIALREARRGHQGEHLITRLEVYNALVQHALCKNEPVGIEHLIPKHLRISIINANGHVLYDNKEVASQDTDNHLTRPEIKAAKRNGRGQAARRSRGLGIQYLYYAEQHGDLFVRTAIPASEAFLHGSRATETLVLVGLLIVLAMGIWIIRMGILYNRATKRLRNLAQVNEPYPTGGPNELVDVEIALRDLSNAKQEALATANRLLTHIKRSNMGIALFNAKGECQYANRFFVQYATLLLPESATSLDCLLALPQLEPVKRFAQALGESSEELCIVPLKAGAQTIELNAMRGTNGGLDLTLRDVSAHWRERQVKQEMTSNVMHEIRTPLTSIRGYLETLRSMPLEPSQRDAFIERCWNQCVRLTGLLDDLRLLAKLDGGLTPEMIEIVDVHALAEEARAALREELTNREAYFSNLLISPTHTEGNRNLLISVIQNLLENALRYGGQGVRVELSCAREDDDYLYLSMRDNGPGVAEEHLGRLFERFYRVDSGRTRAQGGSGLGLSIVRNAIRLHGGDCSAKQRDGGGLEILFHLAKKQQPNKSV